MKNLIASVLFLSFLSASSIAGEMAFLERLTGISSIKKQCSDGEGEFCNALVFTNPTFVSSDGSKETTEKFELPFQFTMLNGKENAEECINLYIEKMQKLLTEAGSVSEPEELLKDLEKDSLTTFPTLYHTETKDTEQLRAPFYFYKRAQSYMPLVKENSPDFHYFDSARRFECRANVSFNKLNSENEITQTEVNEVFQNLQKNSEIAEEDEKNLNTDKAKVSRSPADPNPAIISFYEEAKSKHQCGGAKGLEQTFSEVDLALEKTAEISKVVESHKIKKL